jgi:membrane associated rhomboid family serine protease
LDVYSLIAVAIMIGTLIAGSFKRFSWTQMLVLGNMLVFIVELLASFTSHGNTIIASLGFRPSYLTTGDGLYTIFTNLFVHVDALHLLGNMIFLYLIGIALESRVGKSKFIAIYLIAGIVGALVEAVAEWGSPVIMVGASGAISGAMGAMLLLYPREKIPMIVLIVFLPAVEVWIAVGAWFAYQVLAVLLIGQGPVAYMAHVGGFVAGMALAHYLPSRAQDRTSGKVPKLNTAGLEELATTDELREALGKIRGETQPDVRQAWLEYFAKRAKCPRCGGGLELQGHKLRSTCGYEVELR